MSALPQAAEAHAPGNALYASSPAHELDSCHQVISTLMEALQRHFKYDTKYERPLMNPQFNVVYVLDKDVAMRMTDYMSEKLMNLGKFEKSEFRFTHKTGTNGEVLQRLRLEFPDGVNASVIRKLQATTDRLEGNRQPS